MTMRYGALAAGAAAILALAACQKKAGGEAAGNTTPPAQTPAAQAEKQASTAGPAAGPIDRPHRKAGLWEQTVHMGQMTQVSRICLDEATDKKLGWEGRDSGRSECSHSEVKPMAGGWEFSSTCNLGQEGKMTSHGTVTGDFSSKYKVEIEATTSGSSMPQANGARKFAVDAEWKGPCPAGMKPGDLSLPNGMTVHAVK